MEITSNQRGLITRRQLTEVGIGRHTVGRLVQTRQLVRLSPRVLHLNGIHWDPHVSVMAAVLDSGGFASHSTAAAIWGAPHFDLADIHVTRRRGGRVLSSNLGTIHETRYLPDDHVTSLAGIPVLRPLRLLFDIAGTERPARTEVLLDWMWARRIVTIEALEKTIDEIATPGRPGITVMRRLIDARHGEPPYGSNLERRLDIVIRMGRLPRFERQVDLGDDESWIGRVDFVCTTHRLVIEVDSELHHSALSDRARDARRKARLEAAGFMVRVITEADLFGEAHLLIAKLRQWIREAPRR